MNDASKRIPESAFRLTALAVAMASGLAGAAITDIGQTPLTVASPSVVKPNIMFVLDDSGSMDSAHAPDDADNFLSKYGYKSSQCNSIYYNPAIDYIVPKRADNTSFPNATFTNALKNGYDSGDGSTDLRTQFRAHGSDSSQVAYYYRYTGSQTVPNFSNTSNLWYRECNSNIGSNPGQGVFTKVTVPSASAEAQNFANWYTYYRTRLLLMKSGAGRAFSTITDRYRVGFMTINRVQSSTASHFLNIGDFNQAQKDLWYQKFYDTTTNGSTPLRVALSRAGRIYGGRTGNDPIQYSCQQNFTILTTDGFWNESSSPDKLDGSDIGNQDRTLPRPKYEGPTQYSNTLSDTAAYYYNTDLRTGSTPGGCATGVSGADVCSNNVPASGLDTATHQHMTLFTLGLGVNGQLRFEADYLQGGSADYNAIVSGSKNWPKPVSNTLTTIDDLWHAAVNANGQYFSAKDPDLLVIGLRTALAGVSAREASGTAAATSSLEPVAGDNSIFVATYRTQKWDGELEARTLDVTTGAVSPTATWSSQALLDARVTANSDTRRIFTVTATGNSIREFLPGSFTAAEKNAYFNPSAAVALTQAGGWLPADAAFATADNLIGYLRGRNEFETRGTNAVRLFRDREHVLGDMINGKPVFVRKPPFNYGENNYPAFKAAQSTRQGAVYVPSNDGMLHAFNADTGQEMWAYVPSFAWPKMKVLADADYSNRHAYIVDGSPTLTDIYTGSAWKTILVAGMNAGGKGYYALDVTNPASPSILWEFTQTTMGFTFGNPVVGKMIDGTWVVAVTSGYNNADGVGRLYVLNAATGALLHTISTGVGTAATPSGLGKISAWVDDGLNDNTIQRIYGGDMLGNVWRFDINNTLPPSGRDAFNLATLNAGGYVQPISTRPELGLVGTKPMVYVGTGRYIGPTDLLDQGQQSLYAIKDRLDATPLGNPRTTTPCAFTPQIMTASGSDIREVLSPTPVDVASATTCGWYVDFNPGNNSPGERVNIDMRLQLGVLSVVANIPEQSVCSIGGYSFLYFFDFAGGGAPGSNPPVGSPPGTPPGAATIVSGGRRNELGVGQSVVRLPDGKVIALVTGAGGGITPEKLPENPTVSGATRRVLWRELLN